MHAHTLKQEALESIQRLPEDADIDEPDVREISLYSWRIMYEIVGDTLYVHGIIHKRRDFKPEDLQR